MMASCEMTEQEVAHILYHMARFTQAREQETQSTTVQGDHLSQKCSV